MTEQFGNTCKISQCGEYRYSLTRPSQIHHPANRQMLFIMLNPSTADALIDDQTMRRCRDFAARSNCDGLEVVNLYALRSKEPKNLWLHKDPVGPLNDDYIKGALDSRENVICAWGADAKLDRVNQIAHMIHEANATAWCLGLTKHGAPRHPLYIKRDQPFIRYEFK